jgi:CHAT domain-containing protein/tetratricopeptide (TPR) repeat protein
LIVTGLGCSFSPSAESSFDHAYQVFLHGDLRQAQKEAERGCDRFQRSNPEWAWKFRVLEAETLLRRGMSQEALAVLHIQSAASDKNLVVEMLAIEGIAYARLHSFPEADGSLQRATQLCAEVQEASCGSVLRAQGILALERGQLVSARKFFEDCLSFARLKGDRFLEASALLNLSASALMEEHFGEAADWADAAYQSSVAFGVGSIATKAVGNLGWAYYKLGDSERSLELFRQTENRAAQLGEVFDQENQLTNIGYIYVDRHQFDLASQTFRQALNLAEGIKAKQDVYNALRVLARLSLKTGDSDKAGQYAEQAQQIARESGNHADELYPTLIQGQVAEQRGDAVTARHIFDAVQQDQVCPVFLKWEAQHSLALLYEHQKQADEGDREYRAALATFEAARASVKREDFHLSFLTNATQIYDDYVHFLVARGKTDEALRWADYSRARTLSEGLGLLSKGPANAGRAGPPALNPREISRRAKGVLFFYWLGERQSYLWAITPLKTSLFLLPPGAEIDSLVQRYRKSLNGPEDALASSEDGRSLYRTLIAPAKALLASNTKVFIIPDGSLNNLNFETLVVDEPKPPHYWIEDADVVNASSLRVLASSFRREGVRENSRKSNFPRKLLLIGDSVAPSKEYPELPRAGEQMASVARHFPAVQEQVYQRDQATPSAYLTNSPEKFSHIHFVAHGTASRLSPLDSAIVLSKSPVETDSFKLYARDIVQHPMQADLVTISSCYGAGSRAYSGEGLVGLAWAFLRAGAHNVIASLWEVTDSSTEQLMDRFYDELDKGASPDAALRAAKLALLHGSAFHNPFYWAPFQLYTGS